MTNRSDPSLRGPVLGAAALITLTLVAVGANRLSGTATNPPMGSAVVARELRFTDAADGGIAIRDAEGGAVSTVAPGTGGFLRATLRGLARERRLESAGPDTPFRLTAWSDGRLTLADPATGRFVDLEAFGPTNAQAFARLLILPVTPAERTP